MLLVLAITFKGHVSGQLLINEMMASNASTLEDQFSNYPDWIEIYNPGPGSVQLGEYWISDDLSEIHKWNIPHLELDEGAYFLLFASGKDIGSRLSYWHTVINTGEVWKYTLPESDISGEWRSSTGFTSSWNTGKAGFGYGDNDDSTIIESAISVFMQKEFYLEGVEQVTDAMLFMDYDDGFVAYLNGTEIARSGNMGTPGTPVSFDQSPAGDHEANMYNGSPPESFSLATYIDLLEEGSNVLAVEVHNVSASSSDLTANPFLILGFSNFQSELLYRNPYLSIKDNFPHTNFKITSEGEAIYLSDNVGNIVDQIANIKLPTDFSYGRVPGEPGQFGYYADPTPGGPNGVVYSTEYFTDSVRFIIDGQDFGTEQSIHMESDPTDDRIYYTVDGSEPDINSTVYSSPIDLYETTVVRARIIRPNSLPGPVTTHTCFIGNGHDLPIVSVSMDPEDLWDYNKGIYVMGPNAADENPHQGANFWQDWERPAHLEIYSEDHELLLSQDAGTKIFGGWSRAHPQKSMSFFARKSYGDGSFSCKLFKEKEIDSFEAFVLRNSGNDWCNGNFRDALSAHLSAQMHIDHQAYQPYVMYLNGAYWGLINMREKINEHFVAENHHVYPEDVNLVEGRGWIIHGSEDSYNTMYDFITGNDLNAWQNYDYAGQMMDLQNYIRFYAFNIYINNKDWPGNNNKFWSTSAPGSKYRWISFDTDFAYSIWNHTAYTYNTLEFALGEGDVQNWANQPWAVAIINSLIENEDFKNMFINEFAGRMNTTFHADQVIPVIDSFEQRLIREAPDHHDRWTGDLNSWQKSVERMRTYFRERPAYMRQHLMDRFGIADIFSLDLNVSDPEAGNIRVCHIEPDAYPFSGLYFKDIPIVLEAVPRPGFVFSHWTGDFTGDTRIFEYGMSGPGAFTAVFEAVDSTINLVINEINYASSPGMNTEDWVELYNHSGVAVDVGGWSLVDGFSRDSFYIPSGTLMPSGGHMVFSRHRPDFRRFFPESGPIMGDLSFGLSSEGDGIGLYDPDGNLHDHVIYGISDPWPEGPNGQGSTLELVNPNLDNLLPGSWKASLKTGGTPVTRNSTYKRQLIPVDTTDYTDTTGIALYAMQFVSVYPSPFSGKLHISFWLAAAENVKITLWSSSGRMVAVLRDEWFSQGTQRITWETGERLVPGMYFVHIRSGNNSRVIKVIHR